MASVAFSGEFILPIKGRAIRPTSNTQTEAAMQWTWRAVADAASGIAFLGTLGWVIWHFAAQVSQMAASWPRGLF